MRRVTHILFTVILLLGLVSCEKDFSSIIGIDAAAPIAMKLSGSNYNWKNEKFSSDGGIFTTNNHPEIVMKDNGGFTLELDRWVTSKNNAEAELNLYINIDKPFKENEVYSLADMACIDFHERGATTTLPSGGTVTDIIIHCYRATEGYIKITKINRIIINYIFICINRARTFKFIIITTKFSQTYREKYMFIQNKINFMFIKIGFDYSNFLK